MMRRSRVFVVAVMFGLAGFAYAGPKEVAETEKAAEREGKVTWRSSLRDDQATLFAKAFQKEYPKIEVIHERDSGSAEKLLREIEAGADVNDVVQVHPDLENEFLDMGVMESVNWKDFNVVPEIQLDQNRTIGAFLMSHVNVYNTKLIKKEEAPKTWEELLDPKWSGKFTVDTGLNAYLRLVGAWGEKKVLDYLARLAKQKPVFVRGHSETMALMAAGHYMISADPLLSSAYVVFQKGGLLAWNAPDPVPVGFVKFAVLKKGKHPNAAKVFLGWLGSKGFKLMDEINPGQGVPFGGTYTEKLFKGKALSWTPTREQLTDRQAFFTKALDILGVPR